MMKKLALFGFFIAAIILLACGLGIFAYRYNGQKCCFFSGHLFKWTKVLLNFRRGFCRYFSSLIILW
ncbi:MAG: hypothetical protein LBL07_13005, partial [Tannerella sp.]|nr:hypothetical protein [Tannerella sp.]